METLPTLGDKKIDAEVIYIHTIKPLDLELISASLKKTKKVLIVEEHNEVGGLGDEVVRGTKNIGNIVYSQLAIPECIIHEYGSYQDICDYLKFTPAGIIEKIEKELFPG